MDTLRTAIACFAAGIVVSVGSRAWYASARPYGDAALYGGLLLGSGLWMLGAYYGYRAVRRRGAVRR